MPEMPPSEVQNVKPLLDQILAVSDQLKKEQHPEAAKLAAAHAELYGILCFFFRVVKVETAGS